MFTGIVQAFVPVVRIESLPNLKRLTLDLGEIAEGLEPGASVATNGVCLTASGFPAPDHVTFDVIAETLERSNLGALQVGDRVNVERSFRVGDEVGGHIVSGHVACSAPVVAIQQSDNLRVVQVSVPEQWLRYLTLKGFVALDGASLTISHRDSAARTIGVSLIPETIERTTLGRCRIGDCLNLEVDAQTQAVVDTVERVLASEEYAHLKRPAG